jgi:hypothetical protein
VRMSLARTWPRKPQPPVMTTFMMIGVRQYIYMKTADTAVGGVRDEAGVWCGVYDEMQHSKKMAGT